MYTSLACYKRKYAAKYLFFCTNVFPQAYLIWVPKLAVPKIGIPLSKWGPEMPPACKASFGITWLPVRDETSFNYHFLNVNLNIRQRQLDFLLHFVGPTTLDFLQIKVIILISYIFFYPLSISSTQIFFF